MQETVKMKVNTAEVEASKLICPAMNCGKFISPNQIDFLLRFDQIEKVNENQGDILVKCPRENCDNRFSVAQNTNCVFCEKCEQDFCPQCLKVPHLNKTCAQLVQEQASYLEQQKLKMQQQEEVQFQAYAKSQNWQTCPNCKAMVEKTVGCNHMTCWSPFCRGTFSFCYLCGKKLGTCGHG